jgi:hypothetical protein
LTRKPCYNSTPQTRSDLSAWREQPGAVQGSHCESCLAFFPRFGRWLSESERLCLCLRRVRQASLMSRPAKATQRFSRANLKRSQLRGWGFLHTRGGFVGRPSARRSTFRQQCQPIQSMVALSGQTWLLRLDTVSFGPEDLLFAYYCKYSCIAPVGYYSTL